MQSREQLEKRVAQLEQQQAAQGGAGIRGIRRRASWELLGLPFYDIAVGPDPQRGEIRGHARGFIAMGDIATGVIALGGVAIGLLSAGGLSIGILAAVGGLAIGGVAFGGAAVGGVALGGGAVGVVACGGGAIGEHVVSPMRRDPEAVFFFKEYGLAACR